MRIKEVLDKNLNLSVDNDKPVAGDNLETMADKTTDYNVGVGRQNYNDNFMGQFGSYFFEDDSDKHSTKLIDVFAKQQFERYKEILNYFIKNISKENILEWKKSASKKFEDLSDKEKESDYKWANKNVEVLMKYLKEQHDGIEEKKMNEDIVTKNDNDLILKDKIKLTLSDIKNDKVRDSVKKLINTIRKEGNGIDVNQIKDIIANINDVVESKMNK